MTLVFAKIQLSLIDQMPGFFGKLKEFVGEFRIEAQGIDDSYLSVMTISFYTDKVEIKEGEPKDVYLEATNSPDGNWNFSGINK